MWSRNGTRSYVGDLLYKTTRALSHMGKGMYPTLALSNHLVSPKVGIKLRNIGEVDIG